MTQSHATRPVPLPMRILYAVITLGVLLGLNVWIEGPNFDPSIEGILLLVGLGVIQAVALNIVNGFTGQFSLGHIGFYAVGAYVTAAMATYGHDKFFPFLPITRDSVSLGASIYPVLLLSLVSGLAAAALGFVVGIPSLRLRGDYLAIVTLGFAQIVQVVLRNLDVVNGNTSFTGISRVHTINGAATNVTISLPSLANFFWVYFFVAVVVAVSFCLRFSNHGLAFMAVRDDEVAAEAMGINTTRYKVIAFVLSAFFTGVAGSLFALNQSQLSNSQFDFTHGIYPVVMVVLGGLGSVSGVTIAAVLLGVLPESLRSLGDYQLVVYPLLLILLMLTRPQGIFGREELSWNWLGAQWNAIKGWKRGAPPLDQDDEHLGLLSSAYYLFGTLLAFLGVIFLIRIGMGVRISILGDAIALNGVLLGMLNIAAGRMLSLRKNITFLMVISGLNCLLMLPIGTILGVCTFIVLGRPTVKAQFGSA